MKDKKLYPGVFWGSFRVNGPGNRLAQGCAPLQLQLLLTVYNTIKVCPGIVALTVTAN